MTKQEFLNGLELALRRKNVSDIPEIVADYSEHFDAGAAVGKSEQQIIIELGAIESIVSEYDSGKSAPSYSQNFGNITNFYNSTDGRTTVDKGAAIPTAAGAKGKVQSASNPQPIFETTTTEGVAADSNAARPKKTAQRDKQEKNAGDTVLGILFSIIYVIGAITIAAVTIGLAIAAIATTISLVVSGVAFSIGTWFIFGSYLIKLSGFFLGLALIMLGILIGKVLRETSKLIKTIYDFVMGMFKKAIKGAEKNEI